MMRSVILLSLALSLFSFTRQQEKTWVAVGDSITYLNDHLDETGNRVTEGYLSRVTEALPEIRYVNQGHNGWTSGGIAQQIDSLGLVAADIYTVFLGTNDWWQGRQLGTLEDYKKNTDNSTVYGSFRIIINKLRNLNNKAKIVLITPLQRADFVYLTDFKNNAYGSYKEKNGQSLEQFANAIREIGEYEHLEVVDLYHDSGINQKNLVKFKRLKDPETGRYKNYTFPAYTHIPFNPETDEYPYPEEAIDMAYDGLHPSDKGNAVIAKMLVKVFSKY